MDLKEILSNKYNINIIEIEKNLESTDGNVYIIKTDENKFVAKLYKSLKHAESMIKVHTDLYNKGFYIPQIINSKDKSDYIVLPDKRIVVLYSFLEGYKFGELFKDLPNNAIQALAKELRNIHNNTSKNIYGLENIPFEYDKSIDRYSFLHFDLTKDNIFYNKGKIGFIDFDDAKYGPSILDVSILISLLFFSKSRGFDKNNFKIFIDSYYGEDIELKTKEIKLIKEYAIKWIDYTLNKVEFNPSTKNSFEIKKKLIKLNSEVFQEV